MEKCYLRISDFGLGTTEPNDLMNATAAHRSCVPPGTVELERGNFDCWSDGYSYDNCCDPKFGKKGLASCWGFGLGEFNYERCCFPQFQLR